MKNAYLFLAEGFEEVEALTVVDLLRRAKVELQMVTSSGDLIVTGSHGILVMTDLFMDDVDLESADMLILPGGQPGTTNLKEQEDLCRMLKEQDQKEKGIAAICAAPSVLGMLGILEGRKACCYPGYEQELTGAQVVDDPVVQDGHVVTARGAGVAVPFGLKLIEILSDEQTAEKIGEAILY